MIILIIIIITSCCMCLLLRLLLHVFHYRRGGNAFVATLVMLQQTHIIEMIKMITDHQIENNMRNSCVFSKTALSP